MKSNAPKTEKTWPRLAVCLVLVALIWIVFGQTLTFDFVNYDDKTYVYGNSLVSAGLSSHGLAQAFVDTYTKNWHPLTLISHMIDCQVFDLKPGGHHFTNVLLHSVATVLLFLFLCEITASFWSSALVVALFGIHPLHVESVAWIAERKDVLSGVFFFLTLLVYAHYLRSRTVSRYLTMSILFACGLMSKPMLVTTPVVLLLLDYWPFERVVDLKSLLRMTLEKLPLFGLSLASSIVTFILQERSTGSIAQLPLNWKIENALVSAVTYICQIFWPIDLAVFYPHPEDTLTWWQLAVAALLLISITWIVFVLRRSRPYLLVGWLWYLVMLLPVIGIVQVGLQGHADRYTYLPQIGLYIALVWLSADAFLSLHVPKPVLATVAIIIVLSLTAYARKQAAYWRNTETLWTHTLAVTRNNDVAHSNYANFLIDRGRLDDALTHFQTALDIRLAQSHPHYDLSLAIIQGNVGAALSRKGRVDEAITHFRQAIDLEPDYVDPHFNLGAALMQKGDLDGAIAEWNRTLSMEGDDAGTYTALGNAYLQKHALRQAIDHYENAMRADSDSIYALNNLAWILATAPDDTFRNGTRAIQLAKKADQLANGSNSIFGRTLAAAYAEAGQFAEAIQNAQRALNLANDQHNRTLARLIQEDLGLYQRYAPLRDPAMRNEQ
jgi:tetratricopeptide (TPR) repeat protein